MALTSSARLSPLPPPAFGVVIVFYFPDDACLERVNRLVETGRHIIVVDNTPSSSSEPAEGDSRGRSAVRSGLNQSVHLITNDRNLGIARALNQGVEWLVQAGCDWALLFDQDSDPSQELLEGLPEVAARLALDDSKIALVGPAYDDPKLGGRFPFVRFRAFVAKRLASNGAEPVDVDLLITSGSCVNLRCWTDIGPMDESLFIDSVDLEWCIRARSKGYRLLGIPWFTLHHELGGAPVNIFGVLYPTHSPLRHYYMFRNAVALCRRGYVPWQWKSLELTKMPLRVLVHGLYFKPRRAHLAMAFKGIYHGLLGRMGPAK
jgi:rhamnosyltransferase